MSFLVIPSVSWNNIGASSVGRLVTSEQSLRWTLCFVSQLIVLVWRNITSFDVFHEQLASYFQHSEQITTTCLSQLQSCQTFPTTSWKIWPNLTCSEPLNSHLETWWTSNWLTKNNKKKKNNNNNILWNWRQIPQFTHIWTLWYSVHWYFSFTSSVLCWFYLFFRGSSLNQSEDDESVGSESNEDELTVKHKVLRKILDYLYTRLGVGLMGKVAGLRSSGLEIEPLLHQ